MIAHDEQTGTLFVRYIHPMNDGAIVREFDAHYTGSGVVPVTVAE